MYAQFYGGEVELKYTIHIISPLLCMSRFRLTFPAAMTIVLKLTVTEWGKISWLTREPVAEKKIPTGGFFSGVRDHHINAFEKKQLHRIII